MCTTAKMSMMMNETMSTMLPHFDSPHLSSLYEAPHQPPPPKRLFPFKIPRVVRNQKGKFESDELFKKLARESEIRYTGYRDRPIDERKQKFLTQCREGWTEVAFTNSGTNLQLAFTPTQGGFSSDVDYNKEVGKVHIKSHLIMNGVCVRWRGVIDLERLDGTACLEFDEENARIEDAMFNEQYEQWQNKIREFAEKRNAFKAFGPHGGQAPNIKVE